MTKSIATRFTENSKGGAVILSFGNAQHLKSIKPKKEEAQMLKYYCDRCGQEIPHDDPTLYKQALEPNKFACAKCRELWEKTKEEFTDRWCEWTRKFWKNEWK